MNDAFIELIRSTAELGASDIHIVAGKIYRRHHGELALLPTPSDFSDSQEIISDLLSDDERDTLNKLGAVDFAFTVDDIRLRVNVYREDSDLAAAIRLLPVDFPTVEELHLDRIARRLNNALEM